MNEAAGVDTYLLGHADVEIRRLLLQGRLYNDHTEHALRLAGLRPGMRVLDVGCGPGDVSFVAARLVGPTGTVLGVDAASEVVELARTRAIELGLSMVKFEQTTIADIDVDEVDAVIGRLILMHLPDPISALRHLVRLVRPGGLNAFCEFDISAVRSLPDSPLSRVLVDATVRAFQGVGLDSAFGATLHSLFRQAGFGAPHLTLAAPVGTANDTDVLAYAVEVWRLMFPVAEQLGLVTDELADVDTLLPRMLEQVAAADAIVILPPMITAWTHVNRGCKASRAPRLRQMDADYVVVGTGSAGSVVANRVSEDPSAQVVVLEAGPRDKDKFIHIPAGFAKLFRSEMDWDYQTEPQKQLDGREIYWPRGKVLGGSSSMNAMMWVRGFAADYNEWAEHAGDQWDYAHLQKYFSGIENGPLCISRQRSPRSSTAAWLTAVQECIDAPEGFCETRVTQRRGARWSTADAYLKPAMRRRNLTLYTEATATRVMFDGKRAVGVEFDQLGARRVVNARREVVLCGGAINSPQLLMLSGIGDRDQLAEHGIDVVAHTPDVGCNLLDHLVVPLGFDVPNDTLFAAEKPLQLVNYLVRRRGMLTSNVGEAYGFVKSRPELDLPDLELIFAPAPYFDEGIGDPYTGHAVVMGPILLKPRSSGAITLRSANPKDKPIIDPRYLTDDAGADRAALMAGLRMCASIAKSPALSGVIGKIARPLGAANLDDEALERALNSLSHTLYHPVGTCRMGNDDASVVDPELRVRGVDGLRIADASVMPTIIRGHTHAPSVLIGEKAADLIRG